MLRGGARQVPRIGCQAARQGGRCACLTATRSRPISPITVSHRASVSALVAAASLQLNKVHNASERPAIISSCPSADKLCFTAFCANEARRARDGSRIPGKKYEIQKQPLEWCRFCSQQFLGMECVFRIYQL